MPSTQSHPDRHAARRMNPQQARLVSEVRDALSRLWAGRERDAHRVKEILERVRSR